MRSPKALRISGAATLLPATVVAAPLVTSTGAHAASLQQVNDWGATNVPSDVSMHLYVPDNVAPNAPVLALIHYCGGTASAVFGQAQGGGIVSAADEYGFIMVVPSSGRCWDVVSDQAWTRNGGGDSVRAANRHDLFNALAWFAFLQTWHRLIAPLLLVPFIENAFKHGDFSENGKGLMVFIENTTRKTRFHCHNAKSNGMKDAGGGIGLGNVKRRLELLYAGKHLLEISEDQHTFTINLELLHE